MSGGVGSNGGARVLAQSFLPHPCRRGRCAESYVASFVYLCGAGAGPQMQMPRC